MQVQLNKHQLRVAQQVQLNRHNLAPMVQRTCHQMADGTAGESTLALQMQLNPHKLAHS